MQIKYFPPFQAVLLPVGILNNLVDRGNYKETAF